MLKKTPARKAKKATPASTGNATVSRLVQLVADVVQSVSERRAENPDDSFVLQPVNPVRIVVAYSGGRDSTALADALAKLFHRPHQTLIASVTVAHVHHGLSPHADEWAAHAENACRAWDLPLVVQKVYVNKNAADGIEAAARDARYKALVAIAKEARADVIMTAHHADDRLETFLIQWMRGAGPEGLTAMTPVRPMEATLDAMDLVLARPWLDVPRTDIETYVKRRRLPWIEDESNADSRFLRNLLRNEVLPVLDKARAGWRTAAARSVTLVAQSADVMRSIGSDDVDRCRAGNGLSIAAVLSLPVARQALCIRSWLTEHKVRAPARSRLTELLRQIRQTHSDSRLAFRLGDKELRRWGANLVLREVRPVVRDDQRQMTLEWTDQSEMSLGLWGGVLQFVPCTADEEGFDAKLLREGNLQVRTRKGGEKIKLWRLRPSRNLKHLYQSENIPEFQRSSLPLVWLNNELIFAAELGSDVRFHADKDLVPERIRLVWVPDRQLLA